MLKIKKNIIGFILVATALTITGLVSWFFCQKENISFKEANVGEETAQDILKRINSTELNFLTQEERKALTGLLKQLTPSQLKQISKEEQEATKELLQKLTP